MILHMPACALDCNLVFLLTLHLDSSADDCSSESNRNSPLEMDGWLEGLSTETLGLKCHIQSSAVKRLDTRLVCIYLTFLKETATIQPLRTYPLKLNSRCSEKCNVVINSGAFIFLKTFKAIVTKVPQVQRRENAIKYPYQHFTILGDHTFL